MTEHGSLTNNSNSSNNNNNSSRQQRDMETTHGADTVLYYARAGDLQGVMRMIQADPTQANYQRIVTPLMWASYCGHVEVAHFLLDCGANIDQTEEGKGRTALYLASGRGHADVVTLLLRRGADPTIKRKGGWCPLSVAASEAHVRVVRVLLDHPKVDVDSRDNDGSTALYRAALWGCTEAVRVLLRMGADPTIPGGGGLAPQAVARARGYRGCIEALQDAERVYELAKARKLRRVRGLLERAAVAGGGGMLFESPPSTPSSDVWNQSCRVGDGSSPPLLSYCAQNIPPYLRGRFVELPLPLVALHDTDADKIPSTESQAKKGRNSGGGNGGASSSSTSSSSSWASWLRGAAGGGGGGGGGGGAAAIEEGGAVDMEVDSNTASMVVVGNGGLVGGAACLGAPVAAMVVRDLSYDVFLGLTEMLV